MNKEFPTYHTIVGIGFIVPACIILILIWGLEQAKADISILPILSFMLLVVGGTIICEDAGIIKHSSTLSQDGSQENKRE